MAEGNKYTTRIIACGVFRAALEYLKFKRRYPGIQISYLPPVLHNMPVKLETNLLHKIARAQKRNERVICLYGECFPDLEGVCQQHDVLKVPGYSCYEMLLGSERFQKLMDETAGTYFLEKELLQNFKDYCIDPLELYDDEMRQYCFKHYKKLLYVRQPNDPDLLSRAGELANFLELSLVINDADYSYIDLELYKIV